MLNETFLFSFVKEHYNFQSRLEEFRRLRDSRGDAIVAFGELFQAQSSEVIINDKYLPVILL
jgi:hypothetical protein